MKIQNVKGGYDFLPKEQKIRNYINDTLRSVFEEYGYNSIETSILCYYDMLSDKYDDGNDILKEIYKLKDQGDRQLGLRYDLTVPFAKFISLNNNAIAMPFKRYEINKVFRDGPVKVGRDREFTQCDVDVVGLSGQMIEAELIDLYVQGFKKLKIDVNIKYNSRKLMKGMILESGIDASLMEAVTTVIDKIEKVSANEFKDMLTSIGVSDEQIDKLLKYFKMSLDELNKVFVNSENNLLTEGLNEINTLSGYIDKMGLNEYTTFTSTLARGQNYYTGNVFEVYAKGENMSSSIGGGGRYDNMITEFISDGEIYPAVGISFGLSPIYEILKTRDEFKNNSILDFYIIPIDTESESLVVARRLRNMGYNVDVEMKGRKVGKALDYANKNNIPYVIVLGSSEIDEGIIKIKKMSDSSLIEVPFDKLEELELK